jgi:hypothetical protein
MVGGTNKPMTVYYCERIESHVDPTFKLNWFHAKGVTKIAANFGKDIVVIEVRPGTKDTGDLDFLPPELRECYRESLEHNTHLLERLAKL